jgi:hypothetical protein
MPAGNPIVKRAVGDRSGRVKRGRKDMRVGETREGESEDLARKRGKNKKIKKSRRMASTNAEWFLAHLGCLYLATRQTNNQS